MISLIIPAYNEERYIEPCLKSILGLSKTVAYEVIVVNNASTDRTRETVERLLPEARIIDEPRKGLTIAYNRGAKEAKGDILAFVDADMVLPPDHLERIEREFEKDRKLIALSGPYLYKDNGKFCEWLLHFSYLFLAMPAEIILNRFLNLGASIASGNSAIRKDAFEKIGGFNENIFYGLEPDLAFRLKKLGKIRFRHSFVSKSSARRFQKEGTIKTLWLYFLNHLWPFLFKKPFTKDYLDIR